MSSLTYCERLSKLGLQSLEERRIFNDCLYIFKLLYGHVNIKFTGLFTFTSNVIFTNMALRRNNSLLLYIPKFNIDAYEHCFALRAARYWNVLHDNIVLSTLLFTFFLQFLISIKNTNTNTNYYNVAINNYGNSNYVFKNYVTIIITFSKLRPHLRFKYFD